MGQSLSSTAFKSNTTFKNETKLVDSSEEPWPPAEMTLDVRNNLTGPANDYSNQSSDLSKLSSTTELITKFPYTQNGTESGPIDKQEFAVHVFGTVYYPFKWIADTSLTSWLGWLSSLAMIIGCVLPYVPQYFTIYKARSCAGFSTFVCLTLLIANILRVAFWFGKKFETPLLIQSIIMILAQILLLELCVRVKRQNSANSNLRRTLLSMNPKYFWRWTDLTSHLVFLIIFTALLGVTVYYFIDNRVFIESLGYCALVTESILGLPQVIRNYRKKSVAGMSLSMVFMWLAGDSFKTIYFIVNDAPYQFWLCGLIQMTIDIVILFQVCLFKQNAPIKMRTVYVR